MLPFLILFVRPSLLDSSLLLLLLLPEPRSAAAHNLSLTDQLGAKLRPIQRQVNVEIHPVERALWRVHALKVLLEVLAAEVGSEGDDFLNA